MKIRYRIPTEMYAFAEIEMEGGVETSPEEIKETYDRLHKAFAPKPLNSLEDKEFRHFIDELLLTNKVVNGQEYIEKMSPTQRTVVNEIKKALKRISATEPK